MTYIRQEWGNTGSEITEETMKNYMAMYKARMSPWTSEELSIGLSPEPVAPTLESDLEKGIDNNILDTHGDNQHSGSN